MDGWDLNPYLNGLDEKNYFHPLKIINRIDLFNKRIYPIHLLILFL